MKRHIASVITLLVLICFAAPAFPQNRFDVTVEGPWILYELKKFDGTNSMLLAIAPDVPGHYHPVFTTGDGIQIDPLGIYCVAFVGGAGNDGTCKPNGKVFPGSGTYYKTMLLNVQAFGDNLSWNNVKSTTRAFLLPMPDSISNDGVDPTTTFRSAFVSSSGNSTQSAIGVQLHYDNGPSQFNLFECTQAPPNAACTIPKITNLLNSGTLRITMKAEEHAGAGDSCDYHVRMAHHSMLTFLDPTPLAQPGHNKNQNVAYIESSSAPNGCRVCDPQQDSIPSSCAYGPGYGHSQMSNLRSVPDKGRLQHMAESVSFPDLGTQLKSFITLFNQLNLLVALEDKKESHQNDDKKLKSMAKESNSKISGPDSCPSLETLSSDLIGKFPTLSQLTCVGRGLEMRARILEGGRCPDMSSVANGSVDLVCNDAMNSALAQSRGLQAEVQDIAKSATSGKDCRAAIMLLKTP